MLLSRQRLGASLRSSRPTSRCWCWRRRRGPTTLTATARGSATGTAGRGSPWPCQTSPGDLYILDIFVTFYHFSASVWRVLTTLSAWASLATPTWAAWWATTTPGPSSGQTSTEQSVLGCALMFIYIRILLYCQYNKPLTICLKKDIVNIAVQ